MNNNIDISILKLGDIILCLRDSDYEVGHRAGPYIVIAVDDDKIYALKGTSVVPPKVYEKYIYKVDKDKVGTVKDTYFHLYEPKIVDKSQFIKRINSLSKSDKLYFNKKMCCYGVLKIFKEIYPNFKEIEVGVGDLLVKEDDHKDMKDFYFVISYTNNKYQCIKLHKFGTENMLEVRGRKYFVDYDEICELDNLDGYVRHDYFPNDVTKLILSIIKLRTNQNTDEDKDIRRGSIVYDAVSLYYIYTTEQHMHLAYSISYEPYNLSKEIEVGGTTYYTDFSNEVKFPEKNNNLLKINQASDIEIEEIKLTKKYSRKNINKGSKGYQTEVNRKLLYSPTTIIDVYGIGNSLIIYRAGNEILLLNYEKYKASKIIELHYRTNKTFKVIKNIYADEFREILDAIYKSNNKDYDKNKFMEVYNEYTLENKDNRFQHNKKKQG